MGEATLANWPLLILRWIRLGEEAKDWLCTGGFEALTGSLRDTPMVVEVLVLRRDGAVVYAAWGGQWLSQHNWS